MDIEKISLERIQTLHPFIREEVKTAYLHINKNILGKGIKMCITQALRTFKEQDELFKKKPKVTNAKGGQSIHNFGLAFDFALFYDRDNNGTFESLSWSLVEDFDKDGMADWLEVAKYLKSIGYTWGGDWKFHDAPHFEKTGYKWRDLLKKHNNKEFITGTTYVNI
ncbi:M15 family metallopeptidase [Flavobacterium chungangensis]|uniref:M15 family metallopeptidase n=1 Tax=Flavobacterium chungangensis TaxID=2708132 RepID=A0ABV8ZCF4_9FLAO